MAGQGIELGVAYLSLVVSSKGVPAQVRAALSGLPEEGRRAGTALGKSMSDAAADAASFDGVKASAAAFEKQQERNNSAAGRARGAMTGFGTAAKGAFGMAMKAATPLVGLFAGVSAVEFFTDAIKGASDLEQSVGAVDAVFKGQAGAIKATADGAAQSLGLTKNAYNEMATVLGSLLKNQGVSDFTGETQKLIGVGADLAAQFGGSTQQAVDALASAMRGESDPIERYGISLNESAVQAELAANGQDKLKGAALEQAKAQARIAIIMRKSADAQGAFARESNTLAGKQARLSALWGDFKTSIGTALLPVASAFLDVLMRLGGAVTGLYSRLTGGGQAVGSLAGWFQQLAASPVGQWFQQLGQTIVGMVMPAFRETSEVVTGQLWPALKTIGEVYVEFAKTVIGSPVGQFIVNLFGSVIVGAVNGVINIFQGLVRVVSGAYQAIAGLLTGDWARVWDGLTTVAGGAVQAFVGFLQVWIIGRALGIFRAFIGGVGAFFQGLWAATGPAVAAVVGAFTALGAGAAWVVGQLVSFLGGVVSWLASTWSAGWQRASEQVSAAWQAVVQWTAAAWAFIRDQVFTPIRDWVVSVLVAAFNNFLGNVRRVWTAVQAVISTVWQWVSVNVFTPIRTWLTATLTAALNAFGNVVSTVWNAVRSVIATAWGWIRANVFTPIRTWLIDTFGGAFNAFRATVVSVWNTVVRTIASAWQRISGTFSSLKDGLNSVWNWFGVVVGGIGKTWDTLKGVVAAPVRYVVNDIIRDKLVYAWNQVASKVGLSTFAFSGMASGGTPSAGRSTRGGLTRAAGGNVPGWSPNDTADNIPAWLTADEFVTRRKSARKMRKNHPGVLEYINAHGTLPGYRDGGTVARFAGGGSVANWDARTGSGLRVWAAWMRSLISGKFGVRDIGGYRPVDQFPDHPSGRALDIMTYSDRSRGDAIASWLMANHKAANLNYLIWKQRSWNPRRGSWKLMPNRGGITANHFDHVHALFNPGGGNPSGLGGALTPEMIAQLQAGGGGFSVPNPLAEAAKAIVNPLFNGAKALIAGMTSRFGASAWVEMMAATAKMPVDQVQKWLINKIDSVFPASSVGGAGADNEGTPVSATGAGVQRWASVAARALQMTGQSTSLLPALLRRMQQESGGNPNAINNWDINAKRGDPSKGLMQVIGSTFRRYAMPGYNTNIYDPMSNILASLRYASAKYGSVAAAYNRRGGYGDGGTVTDDTTAKLFDGGGLLEYGDIALHKTRRPDRVLTERQWHAVERYLPTTAGGAGGGLGGARIEINGIKHDSVGEFAQALDYALIRARNVGRYQTIGA